MHDTTTPAQGASLTWEAYDDARLQLASFLALASSDPRSQRWAQLAAPGFLDLVQAAAEFLARHPALADLELAPGERDPSALDLRTLVTALRAPLTDLQAQFDATFGLVASKECPTYETDYCPLTFSVYRSQQMADVAGFYAAWGLQPSRDMPERPDHVSLELEFFAWLLLKQRHAQEAVADQGQTRARLCRDSQKRFLDEHLAWWLPAFARALELKCAATAASDSSAHYLPALAPVLSAWVALERALLDVAPPQELAAPRPAEVGEMDCSACDEASPTTPT